MPIPISNLAIGGLGVSCLGGASDGELVASGNWGGDDRRWAFQWYDSTSKALLGTVINLIAELKKDGVPGKKSEIEE